MPIASRVPKYRRHSTGLAFIEVSGRRYYLGPFNAPESRQRYAQFIAEIEQQRAAAANKFTPANVPRDLLVSELVVAYVQHARSYYVKDGRPTSQLACINSAMRPLLELFGHTEAAEFSPFRVKLVRERLIENGLARKTINERVREIRRLFRWAGEEEMLPATVWHGLQQVSALRRGRTKAKETEPVRPVSGQVVDATLPYLPPVVRDMVQFQRFTGCRPGEVCKLRPADVDRSGDVWAYRPSSHKTEHFGRDRMIFIGPRAQVILAPYLFRDPLHYCFSPAQSEERRSSERRAHRQSRPTPSQLERNNRAKLKRLRMIETGQRCYKPTAYNRAVRRAVEQANSERIELHQKQRLLFEAENEDEHPTLLPRWRPNQLRHSAASELRRMFGLETARVVLGHSEVETTQIYAERDYAAARAAMKQIG